MTNHAIRVSDWWTFLHDTRIRLPPDYNVTLRCLIKDVPGRMYGDQSIVFEHTAFTHMEHASYGGQKGIATQGFRLAHVAGLGTTHRYKHTAYPHKKEVIGRLYSVRGRRKAAE